MRTEALALALLLPAAALAHQATVSYSELDVSGREVRGELRFSLADVRTQMEISDLQHLPAPGSHKFRVTRSHYGITTS